VVAVSLQNKRGVKLAMKRVTLGRGNRSVVAAVNQLLRDNHLVLRDVGGVIVVRAGDYFTIVRQITAFANALAWFLDIVLYEELPLTHVVKKIKRYIRPIYSHKPNISLPKKRT